VSSLTGIHYNLINDLLCLPYGHRGTVVLAGYIDICPTGIGGGGAGKLQRYAPYGYREQAYCYLQRLDNSKIRTIVLHSRIQGFKHKKQRTINSTINLKYCFSIYNL